MTLKNLSDEELVLKISRLAADERVILTEILRYLREIDSRMLYLKRGYPSLFSFCVELLGYEESQAQRRISAVRLIRELPEVEEKILNGILSLTNVTQAQGFFNHKASADQPLDTAQKKSVLAMLENKSTRQAAKELAMLDPEAALKRKETTRPLSDTLTEVKFVIDTETLNKLGKLKGLLAQKCSRGKTPVTLVDVIKILADEGLKKHDPLTKIAGLRQRKAAEVQPQPSAPKVTHRAGRKAEGRYVPAHIRRQVWLRDKGQCGFIDVVTGKMCGSNFRLQIDHIVPWAWGGDHHPDNLRLRCAAHNQWHARELFGPLKGTVKK